jgi:two-component system response regulator YesN
MYNVWIVDDEPFILEGLYSIVDWSALNLVIVGEAENGHEAIEKINMDNIPVDILITDIAMPEMNGLELICALKEINPELSSIILSGYNEFNYIKEGMKIGIENYLLKPINIEEFTQTLSNTVEKIQRSRTQSLGTDQIELIKDNILYRWVTNRIHQDEWKARSDFLQLHLDTPNIMVVIIKTNNGLSASLSTDKHSQRLSHLVREHTTDYMKGHNLPFLCFQDMDDNTVLICGLEEACEQTEKQLHQHLIQLCKLLEDQLQLSPFITLGSLEPSLAEASISYENARFTLDYALLYPLDKILTYDRVTSSPDGKYSLLTHQDKYAQLLFAHDLPALIKLIDEDFDAFSQIEGITPTEIRNTAVEMIIQMKHLLKETKLFNHYGSNAYRNITSQVFRSATLEQLKSCAQLIAKEVIETLNQANSTLYQYFLCRRVFAQNIRTNLQYSSCLLRAAIPKRDGSNILGVCQSVSHREG